MRSSFILRSSGPFGAISGRPSLTRNKRMVSHSFQPSSSDSLAMLAAIRRASSRVSLRACASFARGLRVARRGNIAAKWRGSRIGAHSAAGAAFTAATATAPASAAAAALRELYATPERSSIFIVENIKCRQADVRDFFLVESNFVAQFGVLRLDIRCGRSACCRYSARKRQRQSSSPQGWGKFALRRLLSVRHVQSPQTLRFLSVNMSQAYEPSCDHQHTWVSSSRATIPAGTELEKERSPCYPDV